MKPNPRRIAHAVVKALDEVEDARVAGEDATIIAATHANRVSRAGS
jgi:hypothetical protein